LAKLRPTGCPVKRWLLVPVVLLAACGGEQAQLDVGWQAERGANGGDAECDERLEGASCRRRVHVTGRTRITVTIRPDAPCTIG
jgi:hypothetical protein